MTTEQESTQGAGLKISARIAFGLGAVLLLCSAIAVFSFLQGEKERDMNQWQIRLGIVADSRKSAVDDWLQEHWGVMKGLAENAALQIYMTELALYAEEGASGQEDVAPETEYLEALLMATAQQGGFLATTPGQVVGANVRAAGQSGLALLDAKGAVLAASEDMPPITGRIQAALEEAAEGTAVFIDIFEAAAGPSIGFVTPVYGIQQSKETADALGFVVGVKLVDDSLFARLKQPGDASQTARTLLVRQVGASVQYMSPLEDDGPFQRTMALDTKNLAAAFAISTPGGFAIKRDYAGAEVLVTGRAISGAPWTVMRKISDAEALGGSRNRIRLLIAFFVLLTLIAAATFVAVWKHGASVRTVKALETANRVSEQLRNTKDFLEVVTDEHPAKIAVVDADGLITFSNAHFCDPASNISKEDCVGKSLASILGPVQAKELNKSNELLFKNGEKSTQIFEMSDEQEQRALMQSFHIPLKDENAHPHSVLMILQDITELVTAKERSERTMRNLVSTLVSLVDRRDPYSAHQSQRVAEVATAIAQEMELPSEMVRAVDLAGNLMNLGKILIDPELLTKPGRLSDGEIAEIRKAMLAGVDLLEGLEFDVPVTAAVRDLQEKWDGSGYPNGLAGEDIDLGARIISVANAFVGMVSPRAYRDSLNFDKATEILSGQAGSTFDRRPVSALVNYIYNRDGLARWENFTKAPGEKS